MRQRAVIRYLLGLALVGVALLLTAWPATAAVTEIVSTGPLTRIIVGDDLTCQVAYRGDADFEFFPPSETAGDCGTFLALGGVVYGPLFGNSTEVAWTLVSQSAVSGSGTAGDPFRLTTVVEAGATGVRVEQTDSYVVGSQSYRTEMRLLNAGPGPATGIVYRAGDCYLQESDVGFGRVDGGAPACVVSAASDARIELWLPITPGSHYMEAHYGEVFGVIAEQRQFPDTCRCAEALDNGAGLSWPVNVPVGGSATIVHETFFSPVGRAPVTESFSASVPGPTEISLDPIVIAQSVALTAGVILLVPFPSALFNSTLEENYDEVMAGVARLRGWIAGLVAGVVGWLRRQASQQVANRRAPPGGSQTLPTAPAAPPPPATAAPPPPAPVAQLPVAATAAESSRADLWRTAPGMLLFVAASALLYAFLDPTFGFSAVSLATLAGLLIGLLVTLLAYGLPLLLFARRRGLPLTVRALPATLLIGVGCVIVSRVADFQPGYLYGLIIGFLFARGVDQRQEGAAEAVAVGVSLVVALVGWFALAVLRGGVADPLVSALIEAATATAVVAGLESAIFALLPLRFLPGAAILAWDRRVWVAMLAIGMFGFAHVLLNPHAGYMADATRTSFLTLIGLLVAFGLASVGFWAWFRFRPRRQDAG